jgi:hypothetical protein
MAALGSLRNRGSGITQAHSFENLGCFLGRERPSPNPEELLAILEETSQALLTLGFAGSTAQRKEKNNDGVWYFLMLR